MSETQHQAFEVIAKEITIALIEKSTFINEDLTDYAAKAFDQIMKQILSSYREMKGYKG